MPILSGLYLVLAYIGLSLPDWLFPHRGYSVGRIVDRRFEPALVLPEPRLLPKSLAETLASRKSTYVADGEMYLEALSRAARLLGIAIFTHPRSHEFEFASRAMAISRVARSEFVLGIRKTLGAPWQKDHQTATAAALGGLARLQQLSLGPIPNS